MAQKTNDQQKLIGDSIKIVLKFSQPYIDSETLNHAHIEYHTLMLSHLHLQQKFPEQHRLVKDKDGKQLDESVLIHENHPLHIVLTKAKKLQKREGPDALQEFQMLLEMTRKLDQIQDQDGAAIRSVLELFSKKGKQNIEKGKQNIEVAFNELDGLLQAKEILRCRFNDEYQAYKRSVVELKGDLTLKEFPDSSLYYVLCAAYNEEVAGIDKAMNRFLFLKLLEKNLRILEEEQKQNGEQLGHGKIETMDGKHKSGKEADGNPVKQPNQDKVNKNTSNSPGSGKVQSPKKVDSYVTKAEYDQLFQKLKVQEAKVEELTRRLSTVAGEKLVGGNPNIADLSDENRPTKLGEKFGLLYDDEWSDAFEALNEFGYKGDDEKLQMLLEILTCAYEFCKYEAANQMKKLKVDVTLVMLEPLHKSNNKPTDNTKETIPTSSDQMNETTQTTRNKTREGQKTAIADDKQEEFDCDGSESDQENSVFNAGMRYIKDFRKATASSSIRPLCQHFNTMVIPTKLKMEIGKLPLKVQTYIDKCVEITWLMCIQDPPMYLQWADNEQSVNKEVFKFYRRSGQIVQFTVWPAVFLYAGGPVVSKGYVRAK